MMTFSQLRSSLLVFRAVQAVAILLTGILIILAIRIVPLTPQVDESFFFADDDPQLQEEKKIQRIFAKQDQIVINVEGKIAAPGYLARIRTLTDKLIEIPEVAMAKSLTHGPKNFDDALTSAFWGRVLIPEDRNSSNIFVILAPNSGSATISRIEEVVSEAEGGDFRPVIAGVSYMIELIRRKLLHDIRVFSLCAVGLFGIMILFVFRSAAILLGCLTASAAATSLTFLVNHAVGIEIGILTANLVALVFVLTVPHTIYFTYNWKRLAAEASTPSGSVGRAFRETLPASFWSMGTTLLGFLSLLLVEAKPLRQLGASGSIGAVCALLAAYLVYPVFLLGSDAPEAPSGQKLFRRLGSFLTRRSRWVAAGFVAAALLLGIGIFRLNTEPSLLSYFPEELRRGLERVDQSGGSSLLEIVLRDSRGRSLASGEAYERLWRLQAALERDPEVGTVISLPMLMAEGKDFPFSFFFSWKTILEIMGKPKYDRIAQMFISFDHRHGRFILRMREMARSAPRSQIIARIEDTISRHGFTPVLVGNSYALQAQLSETLRSSLVQGLVELVVLLGLIGFAVSRSIAVGATMAIGMALVPIGLIGWIGALKAPLDVISAPAANLTLGLGIDDTMIHMAQRWRNLVKGGRDPTEAWNLVRAQLWKPIVVSMLVVCVGFSIFILSQFPPTRRFGLWVVLGTLLVLPAALFFLPSVASLLSWRRKRARVAGAKEIS